MALHLPVLASAAASLSLELWRAQELVVQGRHRDLEVLAAVAEKQGAFEQAARDLDLPRGARMTFSDDTRESPIKYLPA